eukprot:scaffold306_cov525-Prasinococcus_capsulatus_cf.AAC.21
MAAITETCAHLHSSSGTTASRNKAACTLRTRIRIGVRMSSRTAFVWRRRSSKARLSRCAMGLAFRESSHSRSRTSPVSFPWPTVSAASAGVEEITGFLTVFEQGLQHPSELGSADLTLVQGYIYLWDNEQLQDLEGLEKLQAVHGALHMYGNGLTSLTGLYSLTSLGGLNMASNDLLGSLEGLTALQKVNGEVYIGNSQILDLHGLEQVQEVNGSLTLTSNENMQSLNGLSSLTSLQELRVASNPMLQSLTGVNSSLTSLHWLTIAYNDVLDSLDGLAALNSVDGRIFIGYNPSLCQTEAEAFVVAIATGGFGQEVEVINNSPC